MLLKVFILTGSWLLISRVILLFLFNRKQIGAIITKNHLSKMLIKND